MTWRVLRSETAPRPKTRPSRDVPLHGTLMGMLFRGWPDEFLAGQFAIVVLVESLEASFEVALTLQAGFV